jgi:amidophosphoribosyltransferase
LGKANRDAVNPQFCDACFTGDYPIALHDLDVVADRQLSFLPKAS